MARVILLDRKHSDYGTAAQLAADLPYASTGTPTYRTKCLDRTLFAISDDGVATGHHRLVLPPHSLLRGGGRSASAEVAEVTDAIPTTWFSHPASDFQHRTLSHHCLTDRHACHSSRIQGSRHRRLWLHRRAFLDAGFPVRGTVRSKEKGEYLSKLFKDSKTPFEYTIVEDIATPGAFDDAVKGVVGVAHTASPFHFRADDPNELITPAVQGTLGVIESLKKNNFDESNWNQFSLDQVKEKGRDSAAGDNKTLAEKAFWKFIEDNKPSFDGATINPPLVSQWSRDSADFRFWVLSSRTLRALKTSTRVPVRSFEGHGILTTANILNWFTGNKTEADIPDKAVYNWVDVRDVALAHVRALTVPQAGGNRFITANGITSPDDWVLTFAKHFPDRKSFPKGDASKRDEINSHANIFDGSKTKKVLGIDYIDLDKLGDRQVRLDEDLRDGIPLIPLGELPYLSDVGDQAGAAHETWAWYSDRLAQTGDRMKFGTLLELNSNVEWWDHYVDYDQLKKLFPSVPLDPDYLATQQHGEQGSLLPSNRPPKKFATPDEFRAALDRERNKVATFYEQKLEELRQQEADLEAEVRQIEDREFHGDTVIYEEGEWDTNERDPLTSSQLSSGGGSPTNSMHRPGNRKRGSIFGRLPGMGRASVSGDHADIFQSTLPAQVRTTEGRRRSIAYAEEGEVSPGTRTKLLPPTRGRALSEVSSADDPRRQSFSTLSSAGNWRQSLSIHGHNLGLVPMNPSAYPEWLKEEVARDEEAIGLAPGDYYNWTGNADYATVLRIGFKKRISALWLDLYALKQYVDLNFTAFEKILKKYDKNTNNKLKKEYIQEKVLTTYPWTDEAKRELDLLLNRTLFLYRRVVVAGDEELAKEQLRAQLRERIVVDRETVWSQMVSDRRGQGIFRSVEPDEQLPAFEQTRPGIRTPCGRIHLPKWLSMRGLIFCIAVFALVATVILQPMDRVEESNCLALLLFCTILWASEAIPLFVTSLAVPFLVVVLRVLRSDDGEDKRLPASDATKYIFSQMFSPTIMLLIGGFTIAAGLSRTRIDHMTASRVLTAAGSNPSFVLLVLMFVACFASMWISNVAAPTLCYALVRPILDELPPKSVFSKCLIIAIALASNIGGQASPISSPQNLIALGAMVPELSWLQWFAISLPVGTASIIAIWAFLHLNYKWEPELRIPRMRKNTDAMTMKHYFVLVVTLFTIALWCVEKSFESTVGDMGIIAIIPLIAFFGTGILRKEDFHDFQWPIVFLAMGGVALGKAVLSSGLLESMDKYLERMVEGMGLYSILVVFCAIALVIATFISHTIAAVLLVPIASRIGENLADPHPRLLIMATALICSAGMGLPVSGFPNMTAITQENKLGHRFINANDFLRNGIPASILAAFMIVTLGYAIMRALGM
ncbi:phosphate transporter [Trichosporon asahii var. asahii CBS 2479]|uniref:Phosphate transporter n=1 Tax=Trichosporon asahii var. asahii (strain ATCC 90039 / CBS 2479 / JCM 2466 / KCTC 7840 / NBRC 103889/ NCYC 2677 / UAMH 7654) TaxID=1186058 RepID=J5QE43_TRIAS|nr:phosphate transporter [Trichosporon asahii var. asahii CBS 2479]EJT46893.1 phosphate transporter [Trichosporon asahii var. asahii CBS 2479]